MSDGAGADTAPVVAEIGRARADMAVAVEALAHRVSPQKLKVRIKEKLTAKVAEVKERINERINPVRIVQRKMGHTRPAVGSGRGVLTVGGDEQKRLPSIR